MNRCKLFIVIISLSSCASASFLDCQVSISNLRQKIVLVRDVIDLEKGSQQINYVQFLDDKYAGFSPTGLTILQAQILRNYGIYFLKVLSTLEDDGKNLNLAVESQTRTLSLSERVQGKQAYHLSIPLNTADFKKNGTGINASIHLHCDRVESNPEMDPSFVFETEERYGQLNWPTRSSWAPFYLPGSTFTDPKKYNPAHFQFIVHGLTSSSENNVLDILLKKPESIKNTLISASLVTEQHVPTYGRCGFILAVPSENVFAAKPSDMGLNNAAIKKGLKLALRELKWQNARRGLTLLTPREVILKRKSEHLYNEIGILGTTVRNGLQSEVAISGVFFIKGEDCIAEIADPLREYATNNDLPIIELPAQATNEDFESQKSSCWQRFIESFYERFD